MVDISVIIVNWNAKKYLLDCLESLDSIHDGFVQEIIVVDNASSDGSNEAVSTQFPQVKLIKNKDNLGFARANNIGIQASGGRYVCLVNSDIIVQDDCVGSMIEFMDQNLSVGMAGPRILNPDGTLQCSCRHFPGIWNNLCQAIGLNYLFPKSVFFSEPFMKYWAHDTEQKVDVLTGCFWIVRREAMDEVGLLDEDFFIYGEDIDWCRRFHQAGWDVMFWPGAEAIHFGGASSNRAPIKFHLEMEKADLHYWAKYHGKCGQIAYAIVLLFRHTLRLISAPFQYICRPSRREDLSLKLRCHVACIRRILFH